MCCRLARCPQLLFTLTLLIGNCESALWAADDNEPDSKSAALLKTFAEEFVAISPGEGKFPKSFQMGSDSGPANERPVHKVTFGYKFAIARYEVPQNLYEAVMGKNPSRWKGPRNSVEMMTWKDATEFCQKVTVALRKQKLIADDEEIRLPTEAEWEYCCRAGTTTRYSFGDDAQMDGDQGNKARLLDMYGWHTGNAAGNDPPVGALKPNPWGLYDMHGYLWEFTADHWSDDYDHAPEDGAAMSVEPNDGHVLRSGSWKDKFDRLTSTARRKIANTDADDAVGFRCVKGRVK
ncbi:MAG: formylglycine-generating enzyme family protein [Planctomycetes bacterium]|nr:formylglycine-generating enzyme family protein [Planctomycetota bacterium]